MKNKLNEATEMILSKLAEDAESITESSDGFDKDPLTQVQEKDPIKSAYIESSKKAEKEKSKAYNNVIGAKLMNDKKIEKSCRNQHDLAVSKYYDIQSKKAAHRASRPIDEDIDDASMFLLAEEFENDLRKSSSSDIVVDSLENKIKKDKDQLTEKSKDLEDLSKEKMADLANKNSDNIDRLKRQQEKQKEIEENKKRVEQEKIDKQKEKIKQQQEKIEKIKSIEKFGNGVNSMEDQSINEGIFKAIKSKLANHKFDKLSEVKGKLSNKLALLNTKKLKAQGNEKLVATIDDKIAKLTDKISAVDEKLKKVDAKLVDLGESVELDNVDMLIYESEKLLKEIDDDPELKEEKPEVDQKAIDKDGELFADESGKILKSLLINIPSIDDPIIRKLTLSAKAELAKPDCDCEKVKELKTKLMQFYKK